MKADYFNNLYNIFDKTFLLKIYKYIEYQSTSKLISRLYKREVKITKLTEFCSEKNEIMSLEKI